MYHQSLVHQQMLMPQSRGENVSEKFFYFHKTSLEWLHFVIRTDEFENSKIQFFSSLVSCAKNIYISTPYTVKFKEGIIHLF